MARPFILFIYFLAFWEWFRLLPTTGLGVAMGLAEPSPRAEGPKGVARAIWHVGSFDWFDVKIR
jgi:hypothetical protein